MRADRFPKVNDVMLAEAMRQLLPVAEFGVRCMKTGYSATTFRRAEVILGMWVRQERDRLKKLSGPLPECHPFEIEFFEGPNNPDPGQIVPPQCERPKRKQAAKSSGRAKGGGQ